MVRWQWHFLLWLAAVFPVANAQDEDEMPDDQDIAEEAMSPEQLRALHAKFDQNGDGKVSLSEVLEFAHHMSKAIAGKDVSAILEEIDTDKDGNSPVETAKFKAADVDKDQFLSVHEVASLFYPETWPGDALETNPAVLDVVVEDTMKLKDKDGDGVLTAKEFWEFGEEELSEEEVQDFQKLDKDGDGVLNMDELRAWESGLFHTEAAMIKLIQIADKDGDMQATAEELENAREESRGTALPEVTSDLIDMDYDSPVPQYPDFVGEAQPGLEEQRATPVRRAREALLRAFATPWPKREVTLLVVGHGASHDYVTEAMALPCHCLGIALALACLADCGTPRWQALAPGSVPLDKQTPFCADHVAITTLLRHPDGSFRLYGFNEKVPRLLASAWQHAFRWRLEPGEMPLGQPGIFDVGDGEGCGKMLLFNYKINLFEAEAGTLDLHDAKLLQNMKRTVQWFQNITGEKADVEMWDDSQCLSGLQQLKAGKAEELGTPLAFDFAMEELGMIRSDLCRLVMLYNFGGYYFDTDMAPLDTLQKSLDLRATFVTVRASLRSGGGGGFFQSFLAATPQHPLMKRSLKSLGSEVNLRSFLFKIAYDRFIDNDVE
eukprot:Skav203679  [mRNA]  locus=scaffold259:79647:87827:+ [translate_table: standard]